MSGAPHYPAASTLSVRQTQEIAPNLVTFMSRGDRLTSPKEVASDGTALASLMFRLFNLPSATGIDLPVAAVTRVADGGLADDAWWLRADPVCLQPYGRGLLLQPGADLGLSQAQAQTLMGEILQVFSADGWHLEAPVAHRWYLRLATPPALQTTPLAQVAGRDIHPYLPAGKDARAWHVVMNEIQILLHTSNVNVERESRGQLPINSLWFWGGGRRPALPSVTWTHLWSDEVLSQGLAILAGLAHSPLPTDIRDWLTQVKPGRHLMVLDEGALGLNTADADPWPAFFSHLEQQWIAPLVRALKFGTVDSVTLYNETGQGVHLTPKTLGRWWRRRRALGHDHPSGDHGA